MSIADRFHHKTRELRGRLKRTTGRMTGNRTMQAEGMALQADGWVGGTEERIKTAFRGRRGFGRRRVL